MEALSPLAGTSADLIDRYPESYRAEVLDVTDTAAVREVVGRCAPDGPVLETGNEASRAGAPAGHGVRRGGPRRP